MKKFNLILFAAMIGFFAKSQKVYYSDVDREDFKRLDFFEILGRMNNNYLVYKKYGSKNTIVVYGNDMKTVEKIELDFLPDRLINVDFLNYSDFSWMIYQYQKRGIVYCMGIKIDATGHPNGKPFELDTTAIGGGGDSKIYSTIISEDKQQIMIFKIKTKYNKDKLYFTTVLFDKNLQLKGRKRWLYTIDESNELVNEFTVSNKGDFSYLRSRRGSRENIISASLIVMKVNEDTLHHIEWPIQKFFLDDLRLKMDNTNMRYVMSSFYSSEKRGNIEGLYTASINENLDTDVKYTLVKFSDELRKKAKGDAGLKTAFNDYFIKNILIKKDGGIALAAESNYSSTRGSNWNRWDYMNYYNPYFTPFDNYYLYNSPFYNNLWGWNRFNNFQSTRYYADNILLVSLDKDGKLVWDNVIFKSQYDDDNDFSLSYGTVNLGGEVHFLFNEPIRRDLILADNVVTPDGKVTRLPTLKNIDLNYEILIRYGKQVSSRVMIAPAVYRNSTCFVKIEL